MASIGAATAAMWARARIQQHGQRDHGGPHPAVDVLKADAADPDADQDQIPQVAERVETQQATSS